MCVGPGQRQTSMKYSDNTTRTPWKRRVKDHGGADGVLLYDSVAWRKVVDPHPGDAVVAEIRRHVRKQPGASALTACASRQVCHARRGHVSGRSFYDRVYVHLDAIPHYCALECAF